MSTPIISINQVTKVFATGDSRVQALRGVDLAVQKGEMVAIMGASGSGKSTLMHILGCLERPTSGRYFLNGQDITGLSRNELAYIRNRRIGFVFQSFNLLSNTTARENVCLPLIYAGIPREKMISLAWAALRQVGLEGRERHLPTQLSGGQQQRVAIARALVNEPDIILADEPTGALDSQASMEVMSLFQHLHQERELTVIIVTHEKDIAEYCQRLVRLRDGVIVEDTAIKESPRAEKEIVVTPGEEEGSA